MLSSRRTPVTGAPSQGFTRCGWSTFETEFYNRNPWEPSPPPNTGSMVGTTATGDTPRSTSSTPLGLEKYQLQGAPSRLNACPPFVVDLSRVTPLLSGTWVLAMVEFADRVDAGRRLAERLEYLQAQHHHVLALQVLEPLRPSAPCLDPICELPHRPYPRS